MTVVLAHTPTPAAESAFRSALRQAQFASSRLVILTVASNDALADPRHAPSDELQAMLEQAGAAGVEAELVHRTAGDAPEGVLEYVEEVGAELLVLGIRHRSAVGKLLTGSTAQRILMGADCDVLAVKAPR